MAFSASANDKFSNQIYAGTPNEDCIFSPREWFSVLQNKLGLPQSYLTPFIGRPITNNANCPTAQVDAYGHSIKTVTGATGDGTRRLHDSMNDDLSIWLYLARIFHIGGCYGQKRTCKDFSHLS